MKAWVTQSYLTLCDPMDCSPPGSSVHGILQARVLEYADIPFSRGSFQLSDRTQVSWNAGRFFTAWVTRDTQTLFNYFYSYSLPQKAMAPHSSTLAWKIPWMAEIGRLQSMGSLRVGHDWATSLSFFTFMHWRRQWQPTPALLPGESQGQQSLVGCHLWVAQSWTRLKQLSSSWTYLSKNNASVSLKGINRAMSKCKERGI